MAHVLPDLPYAYDALEPYISRQIMELHHKKTSSDLCECAQHCRGCLRHSTAVVGGFDLSLFFILTTLGHINHSLFWQNLAPAAGAGGQLKPGPLKDAIDQTFGGLDNLKKEFNTTTAGIQGSGWGWLGVNPSNKRLEISTTPNQDPLLNLVPIIGVDIWEHAFYLQYLNVKADYLNAIWSVINFDEAQRRYVEATQGSKL
uniref:Superoxide dismutase [Mn], mitochondrial n=2 Tax=Agaricus bisporus TaxID=5341 RepID=SODM_AGABI|nr:RecName: Full=Superoxide dismutase [Mn], mitochondrial; Flags: Precursor [Agaricus bisporus]CAB94731.1 manganese superoxide dismutase [Agaricus bisporus]